MKIEPKAPKLTNNLLRLGLPYKLADATGKLVSGYDKIRSSIAVIIAVAQYKCKSKHLDSDIKSSIENSDGVLGFIKNLRHGKIGVARKSP